MGIILMPKPKFLRECEGCHEMWPMTLTQKFHSKPCKGTMMVTQVWVVCIDGCGRREQKRPDKAPDGKWRCQECYNASQITDERARFDGYAGNEWPEPAPIDGTRFCVEWGGTRDKDGYGVFHLSGQVDGKNKQVRADRYAWNLVNEPPLRPDQILRHDCDNPPCIRLSHLQTGGKPDNTRDMVERNRQAKGEAVNTAVLTEHRVRVIRDDYETGEYSQQELAAREGVSQNQISRIVRRLAWPHVA